MKKNLHITLSIEKISPEVTFPISKKFGCPSGINLSQLHSPSCVSSSVTQECFNF